MRFRASVLCLLTSFGCASKPPEAQAPVQTAAKPAAVVEAEAAVDLSPVAAPDDLIAVGRVARPRALFETLANWSGIPLHVSDLLPGEARVLNDVVAWDAPVEAAAVLERHSTEKVAPPEFAVSVGLTSMERALAAAKDKGFEATRVSSSVYRVSLSDDVFCAVAAATGAAPVRLVCSSTWQNVEDLLPYVTRGLPREDFGGKDLYIALKPAPLQHRYTQEIGALPLFVGIGLRQIQTDSPRLDRALTDAAYGLAGEAKTLAMQLDGFEVSARLDDTAKAFDVGYSFGFTKDESFIAQLIKEAGQRSSTPSEAFWDMPKTSASGQYAVGLDPKAMATLMGPLSEIVDAFLEQQKAPTTFRSRFRSVFDSLPAMSARGVQVAGSVPPAKDMTPAALFASNLGWRVGILDSRPDKVFKLFTDLEAIVSDRELVKLTKQLAPRENVAMPKVRHKVVKVNGFPARATEFIVELPTAWLEKLDKLPKGLKDSKKPISTAFIVVPDGEQTWFGLAAEEKAAITALEGARAGRNGKLRELPELAPLKEKPAMSHGFFTLEALFASLSSLAKAADFDAEAALAHAPNHGRAPWLSRVEQVPHGSGLRLNANVRVPQKAFEDIAGVAPFLIQRMKR